MALLDGVNEEPNNEMDISKRAMIILKKPKDDLSMGQPKDLPSWCKSDDIYTKLISKNISYRTTYINEFKGHNHLVLKIAAYMKVSYINPKYNSMWYKRMHDEAIISLGVGDYKG